MDATKAGTGRSKVKIRFDRTKRPASGIPSDLSADGTM